MLKQALLPLFHLADTAYRRIRAQ